MKKDSGRGIIPLILVIALAIAIILAVVMMLFQDVLTPLGIAFGPHTMVIVLVVLVLAAVLVIV